MIKYIAWPIFLLLLFCIKIAPASPEDVIIREIEVTGLTRMSTQEFRDLFGVQVNAPLDRESIRQGIKRVFLTESFEDVVVIQDDRDPSKIIIQVKEKYVISTIKVKGLVTLWKKDILKAFSIQEGQFFYESALPDALAKLKSSIAEKGYPDIAVTSSARYDHEKHTVQLTLRVEEGKPLLVKKVVITGIEDPFELERITLKLNIFPGDIFDRTVLQERFEKIKKVCREEGYYDPGIGPYTFDDGVLEVQVALGSILMVIIKGNSHYSDSRLMEEMSFWEASSIRTELIEEAVSRIVNLYHQAGFVFAQVAPVINAQADSPEITFFIYEGPRVYLDAITLEGGMIGDERIKGILSLKEGDPFNPDAVDRDVEAVQEFYSALGYLDAKVEDVSYSYDESKTKAVLSLRINEGTQILIREVVLRGNSVLPAAEIYRVVKVKPLMPYNEIDISDSRLAILNLYKQRGYLDADVQVKQLFGLNRVSLEFHIEEGNQYLFGYTLVRGNATVRTQVISRQLLNKKGEPFSDVLLQRNTQRLYKLGLFSDIKYHTIDEGGTARSVVLDVKESKAGAVEFGVGYGDYEKYRGFFDISYRNFFGMNREGKFRTELTTISEKYILSAYEPWLYYTTGAYGPVSLRINLIQERKTEKNIDTGEVIYKAKKKSATANFSENLSERVRGELLYSFSVVNTYNVQPDAVLTPEDTGTVNISKIGPGIIYDSRDNPFNPKKGVLVGLLFQVASQYIFSETDFTKTEFNVNYYHAVLKPLTLALSFRGGLARGYNDTTDLPIVERFFLGGRNTVRGYAQDTLGPKGSDGTPTGGNAMLMNNIELRTDVGWGFGLVMFLDAGNVWIKTSDINLGDYQYTTGLGLRYMTPVGPLRVDYGYKLDREEGESSGEIHFSIGQAF
ncbi:MAG: outer membrane protein assembly factor BamA [bacterium]